MKNYTLNCFRNEAKKIMEKYDVKNNEDYVFEVYFKLMEDKEHTEAYLLCVIYLFPNECVGNKMRFIGRGQTPSIALCNFEEDIRIQMRTMRDNVSVEIENEKSNLS
jgi:hypothetical protein